MNKTKEAIEYTRQAYVDDSKGIPAMLLGDVAELIRITTGQTVEVNDLLWVSIDK